MRRIPNSFRHIANDLIVFGTTLVALCGWPESAAAAPNESIATLQSGFESNNLNAAGSFRLFVFSQQSASLDPATGAQRFPALGPNAVQSITAVRGGVPGLAVATGGALATTGGDRIVVSTGVAAGQNPAAMLYGINKPSNTVVSFAIEPTIGVGLTTVNPRTGATTTVQTPVAKQSLSRPGDT